MLAISMNSQAGEHLASNLLNECRMLEGVGGLDRQAGLSAQAWCDVYRALAANMAIPPQWGAIVTNPDYPNCIRDEAINRLATTCHPIRPADVDAIVRILDIATHELMSGDDLDHAAELVTEVTNRMQWRMAELIAAEPMADQS